LAAYNPRQQVSAAVSSRRVKRERGAAQENTPRESRGCPRNGKPLEVRAIQATAASRGGKAAAVRKAKPGDRPAPRPDVSELSTRRIGDRSAGGVAHGPTRLARSVRLASPRCSYRP